MSIYQPTPTFLTDRYQLTMLAAYARAGMAKRRAVFELFVRKLPPTRRYMVACGLGRALPLLSRVRFSSDELDHLERDPFYGPAMAIPAVRELLESFRFKAKVWAVPEGRLCYPKTPLVRVEGTLAEAQLVETLLLSIYNHDTRVASKCSRIVHAAAGRPCFEFGTRRTHERAAVDAARAAFIAGFVATSNEEAARSHGIPVAGTMAHAFLLAHAADFGEDGEEAAFADFGGTFDAPTTCLVDTFDTLRGVERAARALGPKLGAIRIDSGDLGELARGSREILDKAGLRSAKVGVSDDLDEYKIDALIKSGAPIESFGVGTMAVSSPDAPSLGAVYKLVAIEDSQGRMVAVQKRSPGKGSAAAIKQVFRKPNTLDDVLGLDGESLAGEHLLVPVYDGSSVIGDTSVEAARKRHAHDIGLASAAESSGSGAHATLRSISPRIDEQGVDVGYPLQTSEALEALHARVEREGRVVL